jgi:ABC-type multidrug transport system ATPase subunit
MTGAENRRKRYGEKLAVDGRDFVVQSGIVLGLDGEVNG